MTDDTKRLGTIFIWLGWLIGLSLLILVFNKVLDAQDAPINAVNNGTTPYIEIILQRKNNGHYIFNGYVNNVKVKFMVDTGATVTSIPLHLKDKLGLTPKRSYTVQTANGLTQAYSTTIHSLKLGDITLNNVNASLVSGMKGQEALLGMNVLKNFELIQKGKQLIIRHYQP